MKRITFLALLICCQVSTIAQDVYTIRIIDTHGKPMSNIEVKAEIRSKKILISSKTDATGTAILTLTEVGVYTLSYLEMIDFTTYEIKEGFHGTFKKTVTYDPKKIFAEKPKQDRKGVVFTNSLALSMRGKPNTSKVSVYVKDDKKVIQPNISLTLVSVVDKMKYTGKTNSLGVADFYLPINQNYEIDLEQIEAISQVPVPNQPNGEMNVTVFYVKTDVKETVKGDSIVQTGITQTNGTTKHLLFTFHLIDYAGNALSKEPVYLDALNKKRVYKGMTDENGYCKFMVEKGSDYTVNVKHERGLYLIEGSNKMGFANESVTRRYRGSAEIERIIEQQKAEMLAQEMALKSEKEKIEAINSGNFLPTYNETPIRPASEPANYLTKTALGYNLNFQSSGPIGTPTVSGDNLFTKEGFYSPKFYCLKASTGQYVWGVELGESGISPAVLHNGVLLINTASCTLYAIEATTGKLLWSKWLSGYVYSTPTAIGDNVYAVYNHGGRPVVVSFNLKTGKLNWLRAVDNECIACPVVEGNEVHIASQSGTYYIYNKDTGKLISMSNTYKAVSSPTITEDKVYFTASIKGFDQVVVLDRKTLKLIKKYPNPIDALKISGGRDMDTPEQMSFNGSHPIVYQNKVVIVTDAEHIIAFDALSEKVIWQQPVKMHSNQVPIISNNKVYVVSRTGDITAYDILTGTPSKLPTTKGGTEETDGQIVAANGLLFIASAGVLSVIKSVQSINWGQWNKDASHNLYWR